MTGWTPRHQANRNLKRKLEGRSDVKPSCSGPPMSKETKDMLRAWMMEAPSTTMNDIRILCFERNISHPPQQLAKWISNQRNYIANSPEEEEKLKKKRRRYEQTRMQKMLPGEKEQKNISRNHYPRQPTPSAAGPAILVEHKLILEKYFNDVSRVPRLVDCRDLIAKNEWTEMYSAHQIQKWFKNMRRRKGKTGGREVQQNKYLDEYRETSKLLVEPVQSLFVPNPIDSFSFDEPTLNVSDIHMSAMPSVEDEGVVDDNIFGNLEDIEDVGDLLFI